LPKKTRFSVQTHSPAETAPDVEAESDQLLLPGGEGSERRLSAAEIRSGINKPCYFFSDCSIDNSGNKCFEVLLFCSDIDCAAPSFCLLNSCIGTSCNTGWSSGLCLRTASFRSCSVISARLD